MSRALARVFAAQNGVASLAELEAIGLHRSVVSRRAAAGRLFRLHQGVYSIVPPRLLKVEGHWLAAVLACGEGAVLSHSAAAALWNLRRVPSGPIQVTVATTSGRRGRKRKGIAIHRSSTLSPSQTTLRRGIPVTTPARTLADLRPTAGRHAYESALRQAEILRLDTGPQPQHGPDPGRTELERRFLALCRRHSLPRPHTQQIIGPYTVDFLWPEQRLVVEVDGYGSHGTRSAFEDDRARDAQLKLLGCEVIRFTWRQISDEPAMVVGVMRGLLARP